MLSLQQKKHVGGIGFVFLCVAISCLTTEAVASPDPSDRDGTGVMEAFPAPRPLGDFSRERLCSDRFPPGSHTDRTAYTYRIESQDGVIRGTRETVESVVRSPVHHDPERRPRADHGNR